MKKQEDIKFTLKPFDITRVNSNSIVVMIGKRKSGKSFCLRDIMWHHRKIPVGLVMSHTDHLSHFYDRFIPSILIHKGFDTQQLTKLFQRQEKALNEGWNDPSAFLVLDDVLSDNSWKSDSNIKEIFFNGRHYKLLFILAMQDPMGLTPGLRGNIDFTFIFKCNNQSARKKIYENYAGALKSQEIFNIVLDATTEDFNCLVIDNSTLSNKMEDQVFYYKAKDHGEFKICTNDIWEYSDRKIHQQQANKYSNKYDRTVVPTRKGNLTINRLNK